jgi:serine/threonine protein kinase/tetratricopeptide (TPR) repeat protein
MACVARAARLTIRKTLGERVRFVAPPASSRDRREMPMSSSAPVRPSDQSSPAAPAPETELARGTALGRFVVLGLVGRGAMGEVYGAYDPDLDRKIAIKLVRAGGGGEGSEGRTRLMREAQATAKISHPNVVVVYDAGTFGERVFIAMEFVDGHTLRYWLQEQERPWQEILEAFLAAGRGLAAAHDKELVHRDFKPDNVMVARGGQVRVMDFGLARIAGGAAAPSGGPADAEPTPPSWSGLPDLEATPILGGGPVDDATATGTTTLAFRDKITATGAMLGTPAYMSPEQFRGAIADTRSDQFSFCVALYEALYGARPFVGRTLEELARNVVAGNLVQPPARRVPPAVRKALEHGLCADPLARFPSMNALLAEIERGAGTGRGGFAAHAAAKLAGVWEAPVGEQSVSTPEKERIHQAFLATGKAYAAASFASASAKLDRYVQRWSELYVEVCEATHLRGEQSAEILDLRMTVLTDGLEDLKALCRVFGEATAEVVSNAEKAAATLPNLERCRDVDFIRNAVRPPRDFETRAVVEDLRVRLADVRARVRVGRFVESARAAANLVEEARRAHYDPILAEALLLRGVLEAEMSRKDDARITLEEAFSVAELARHDEVAAVAAIYILDVEGYINSRFAVAEVWARYAEAILRRMGSNDLLWGWYFTNRANAREKEGRLAEAVEDARRAVEAKTRALGENAFDVGQSYGNLANHLAFGGDFTGAVEANARARAILVETVGAAHPWAAFMHANQAQYLYRLGRFEEAVQIARTALAHLERELDPRGLSITSPMRTLGLCYLAQGQAVAAVTVLARAAAIRDEITKSPLWLAEVHSPLGRALYETGEHERGLALVRQARGEFEHAPPTPLVQRDLAELLLWLAAREKPARRRGARSSKPGAPARPRRASVTRKPQ